MKLSDYIAKYLAESGVKYVFGITGAHIVHLFDSMGKRKDIDYVCTNHEQAASLAAEGYARATKTIGVCMSTSGPGVTNLLTGIACSYFDSIPIIVFTGQVPVNHLKQPDYHHLRQHGFQEVDSPNIYESITKKTFRVTKAKDIKKILDEAFYIATDGRPGPVLIDLPDDIQRAEIDEEELLWRNHPNYASIVELIKKSKKPLTYF